MTDDQLIYAVAQVWVDGGGDAEGIVYSWRKIKEAVERLTTGLKEGEE